MARGETPGSGAPLPAPYRSPWRQLAEALGAVGADLRLGLRRQWRRNREGELPLPLFWPRRLAPLFWPLLLSAALALLVLAGGWLLQLAARSTPAAADRMEARATSDRPAVAMESAPGASAGDGPEMGPALVETTGSEASGPGDRGSPQRDRPVPERSRERPSQPGQGRPSGPDPSEADLVETESGDGGASGGGSVARAELPLDPLLTLLAQGEDASLLLAAHPDPAGGRLSLILAPAAQTLSQAELLERAQRWQQGVREAGYERLELRDSEGRLRGRSALVGSGMILLAPVPGC